ncbi:MAG: hypothetical protein IZT60_04280 [Gammaproteobacteria bacterium]|nr:hypothetical protein [Gammaproteobacteria bacterium]
MKFSTVGATALLFLSSIAAAEPEAYETESVKIIEGDRVDIYEHRDKQGRNRVDIAPDRTKPYSFLGSEIGDEASRPAGGSPDAPTQMWSIKKW